MRTPLRTGVRLLGAAALTAVSLAVIAPPANAADLTVTVDGGSADGTVTLACQMAQFPVFDYKATITVEATRASAGSPVTLDASLSDLPGVAPVAITNQDMPTTLTVSVDGSEVTLEGTDTVSAGPNAPVPVPDVSGEVETDNDDLELTFTKFGFTMMGMNASCAPGEAPPPEPKPTNNPTSDATDKPIDNPTDEPTDGAKNPGTPSTGKVTFACTLSIGSEFDYPADVTLKGFRANEGDPVSLQATLSDLPGMAPVPIQGSMDFTFGLKVGGSDTTLKGNSTVDVASYGEVPVPTLKGEVTADGDELDVEATSFSFDFPSAGIGAECTGGGALSKLGVGDEAPVDDDPKGPDSETPDDGGGTGGDSLPKTGGSDGIAVITLWSAALLLLGAAGLVLLPSRRRAVDS